MTSKPPTPQGISRLLAKAGFTRGRNPWRGNPAEGFLVTASNRSGRTRVRYSDGRLRGPQAFADRDAALTDYSLALTSGGYHVERDRLGLDVTAGEDTHDRHKM